MSKRMFGTARRLPSGRWQARYRDGSGRRVTAPQTFPTKGDAGRFLAGMEADMARGAYLDPRAGRITVGSWAESWLARPGKRGASTARDCQGLNAFLPAIGRTPVSALTPAQVQTAVDARSRVAAPATVARDFSALRACLNAAVDADMILRSPARKVALPRVQAPDRPELTPGDLARLIDEVPDSYRTLVLVGAVLGLRWGEAIGLRVRDVDFLRRTITVAQTVEELAGHLRIVSEGKSRAALRTMAIPPFLVDALAGHLADHRRGQGLENLVFVGPKGGILRRRFGERILAPAVARAGLPSSVTFHALRHVAVTAMADAGVPFNVTRGRAGHATAKLTMELYAHRGDAGDKQAAALLEGHFAGAFSAGWGTGGARTGCGDA